MASNTVKKFVNVAASQTDSLIVPFVAGYVIKVISVAMQAGGTATNVTFNSQTPGSAGTACSATFALGANGFDGMPENSDGWFGTSVGQNLTVTTGSGSTVGIQLTYILDSSL